ncbi:RHS repeat-associated core domain-containing protein, partial [Chryseobacterium flavum]
FGLNHIGGIKGYIGSYLSYKYNGKELQESGFYDYGARMYMPDLGRWGVIDPLAELYRRYSAYNYTVNNPIKYTDPDGRGVEHFGKKAEEMARKLEKKLDNQIKKLEKSKGGDNNERIVELQKSKQDISDMRNDKATEYVFGKAGGKEDVNKD